MPNPRFGLESHPEILEGNHVKRKPGLKELLAQLADSVARIAQEVDEVCQENVELKGRLASVIGTDKSWDLPDNELSIQPPASSILGTDVKGVSAMGKPEIETVTFDDPMQKLVSQEAPDNKDTSSLFSKPTLNHMEALISSESFAVGKKGSLCHLHAFDMKRAWKDRPELFKANFMRPSMYVEAPGSISSHFLMEDFTRLRVIVMDPSSKGRSWWALASLSFLMFDLIFVPFDVSFDVKESPFTKTVELLAVIFWTLDIPVTFLTAVRHATYLEKRLSHIAGHYLRTWFFFDIFLLVANFATLILGSTFTAMTSLLRVARWARISRMLRLASVARAAKLRPLMRQIGIRFHLSKLHVELSCGLVGQTIVFVVSAHILACIWHYLGQVFDDSWVQANHLESAGIGQRYAVSLHWTYSRLCLTMSMHHIQTSRELFLDACLMLMSFTLTAFYLGRVTSVAIAKSNSNSSKLWKASIAVSRRYHLSRPLRMRIDNVLKASHYLGTAEIIADEEMFLQSIPSSLKKDFIFESRVQLMMKKQFFQDMVDYNKQVVVAICNDAITSHVNVATEVLYECGDAGNAMYFILLGTLLYHSKHGNGTCSLLPKGSVISELVLWTDTEHRGDLVANSESRVFSLDSSEFTKVVSEHNQAFIHAVKYAKHFVWHLNDQPQVDDLTEIQGLDLDVVNRELFEGSSMDHFVFISHYKIESGTEATLLRDLMDSALRENTSHHANLLQAPIFIDSEDLVDLARLKQHVLRTDILMVLLTPGIFTRPWCLLEMVTAIKSNTILVPVEVQRPGSHYQYPDEEFYKNILRGKYLPDDAVALLASEGVSLQEVECTIRQLFRKISLPFSPHKTKVTREAEVCNILKRCESELAQQEED